MGTLWNDSPRNLAKGEPSAAKPNALINEKGMGTAEIALSRMSSGAPSEADIARSIDLAMREVVRNPRNPNALDPPPVKPVHAQTKWVEPVPLKVPSKFESDLIDALATKFVGGPNSPREIARGG